MNLQKELDMAKARLANQEKALADTEAACLAAGGGKMPATYKIVSSRLPRQQLQVQASREQVAELEKALGVGPQVDAFANGKVKK